VKLTLENDLDSCAPGTPALTIVGPATVDLNGFSVTCLPSGSQTAAGIVVVGKRATVRNGTVQLCSTGVRLLGEGAHRVEQITVATSDGGFSLPGDGFVVDSDANRLIGNTAVQNGGNGFHVTGSRNQFTGNFAFFNRGIGFNVSFGDRNVFKKNRAQDNGHGFRLSNGAQNTLKENVASENQVGIQTTDQVAIKLTGNVTSDNAEDGIAVFFGSKGRLVGNFAERNGDHGIVVGAANKTVITRNTALNNNQFGGPGRFDLVDIGQPGCGTNRWLRNVFVTANPSDCIR
jgi:parallel beta-helix repeat protein